MRGTFAGLRHLRIAAIAMVLALVEALVGQPRHWATGAAAEFVSPEAPWAAVRPFQEATRGKCHRAPFQERRKADGRVRESHACQHRTSTVPAP